MSLDSVLTCHRAAIEVMASTPGHPPTGMKVAAVAPADETGLGARWNVDPKNYPKESFTD